MRSAVSCAFWGMASMPRPSLLIIAGILMMFMAARASAQKPEEKPAEKSTEKSGDKSDKAHGQNWRTRNKIHRDGRDHFVEAGRRHAEGQRFLCGVQERRCDRRGKASGDIYLQLRAGVGFNLAASWRFRSAPRGNGRRRRIASAALQAGGQRILVAGHDGFSFY